VSEFAHSGRREWERDEEIEKKREVLKGFVAFFRQGRAGGGLWYNVCF
jgi:hypothetical protein